MTDHPHITPREKQVWQLLFDGLSPAEVAERLVLAMTSVRAHIRSLHAKLGVHNAEGLLAVGRLHLDCCLSDGGGTYRGARSP